MKFQICKSWGVRTVNVVRNRDNLDALIKELKEIGADEVFTEEEMKKESRDRVSCSFYFIYKTSKLSISLILVLTKDTKGEKGLSISLPILYCYCSTKAVADSNSNDLNNIWRIAQQYLRPGSFWDVEGIFGRCKALPPR